LIYVCSESASKGRLNKPSWRGLQIAPGAASAPTVFAIFRCFTGFAIERKSLRMSVDVVSAQAMKLSRHGIFLHAKDAINGCEFR